MVTAKLAMVPKVPKDARIETTYKSKVEWIPLRSIRIYSECQRPFDEHLARKIASEFDPDLLGYPVIAAMPSDGAGELFASVDGQHRCAAARIAVGEDQMIECEVIRGIDLVRAAAIFLGRNTRRGVRLVDKFFVGLTAQEPECMAINDVVASLGFKIAVPGSDKAIAAVGALQRLFRKDNDLLRKTLALALASWGASVETFNGDLLSGLGMFLHRYRSSLDHASLEVKLRSAPGGAAGVLGRGRMLRAGLGSTISDATAQAILGTYNSGKTAKKLPDWSSRKENG